MEERPRRFCRRRGVVIVAAVTIAITLFLGWVVAGPSIGGRPVWVSAKLPSDISTLAQSGRWVQVDGDEEDLWQFVDLTSGRITGSYGLGTGTYGDGGLWRLTDEGIAITFDGRVFRGFDHTGTELWATELRHRFRGDEVSPVAASRDTFVVTGCSTEDKQSVVGIDKRTGRVAWRTTGSCTHDPPVHDGANGPIYIAPDGDGWAVRTVDDNRKLTDLPSPQDRTAGSTVAAVVGDLVLHPQGRRLVAIRHPSGEQVWSNPVCGQAKPKDVSSSVEQLNYVHCQGGADVLVDPISGRSISSELVRRDDGTKITRLPDGRFLRLRLHQDHIRATELFTGKELWRAPRPAGSVVLDLSGESVVVSANDASRNTFRIYDARTGEQTMRSGWLGDWDATQVPGYGVLVTHQFFCFTSYSCAGHLTYRIR